MRVSLALLIAVAAASMAAQPADFSVTLEKGSADGPRLPDRVAVGEPLVYRVRWDVTGSLTPSDEVLEIDVPGVVTSLFEGREMSCTGADPVRCIFSALEPDGSMQIAVRVDTPGAHTTTARVIHQGSPDANSSNDIATHTFDAVSLPSVKLSAGLLPARLEPGQRGTFSVNARNHAVTPATNVVLTVTLTAGGTMLSGTTSNGNANCWVMNNAFVCTLASLAQDQILNADVVFTAPFRTTGEWLFVEVAARSAEPDLDPLDNNFRGSVMMPRQFVVENVADEGSGSLRQAIRDLNTLCAFNRPCEIAFRIPPPVPADGWFTIQPRTPLPEIAGKVIVDGSTQTTFTGDTNVDGPEIEINGALVLEGSGLRFRPDCEAHVRNLTVNGFPVYGIEMRRQFEGYGTDRCLDSSQQHRATSVEESYLGTDPRGRNAKPNQRGLGLFGVISTVRNNLIGGNQRSGIYVTDSYYIDISRNTIGVTKDGSPLGNGAGIFFDMRDSISGSTVGADVEQNVIAHNRGMAIARTRGGEINVTNNSIFDNLLQGIDFDVDGPTPSRETDVDLPNPPVLLSATYDSVQNSTIVRGRLDSNAGGPFREVAYDIELYSSARLSIWGYPQAESMLAQRRLATGHESFEIVVPGDLRRLWMTATNTVSHYTGYLRAPGTPGSESIRNSRPEDTSELSNAVPVH